MGVTSSLFFVALSSSNSDPEMGEGSLSEIASYAEITTDSVGDDDETSFDPEEFHPSYKRAVVSKSDFSLQFDVTQSNSWAESLETCKQSGKHLCRYEQICSGTGEPAFSPILSLGIQFTRDQWVPCADEKNCWVQVGPWGRQFGDIKHTCYKHTEIQNGRWGNPEWGKDESKSLHFRGVIPCCNSLDDE